MRHSEREAVAALELETTSRIRIEDQYNFALEEGKGHAENSRQLELELKNLKLVNEKAAAEVQKVSREAVEAANDAARAPEGEQEDMSKAHADIETSPGCEHMLRNCLRKIDFTFPANIYFIEIPGAFHSFTRTNLWLAATVQNWF